MAGCGGKPPVGSGPQRGACFRPRLRPRLAPAVAAATATAPPRLPITVDGQLLDQLVDAISVDKQLGEVVLDEDREISRRRWVSFVRGSTPPKGGVLLRAVARRSTVLRTAMSGDPSRCDSKQLDL
jgi:hypothetical protein